MSPGSYAAKNLGCVCDEYANNYGIGHPIQANMYGMQWHIADSCPIHGSSCWRMPYIAPVNNAGNVTTLVYGKIGG